MDDKFALLTRSPQPSGRVPAGIGGDVRERQGYLDRARAAFRQEVLAGSDPRLASPAAEDFRARLGLADAG